MKKLIPLLLLATTLAHAERFMVEMNHRLSPRELNSLPIKAEPFYAGAHPYFSRLYVLTGEREKIARLPSVRKLEGLFELSKLSLLPSENPERVVEDELFPYQWSLLNQGQTYVLEKDDIHNLPLKGTAGQDIGWKTLLPKVSQKRPVVAVLDSGADLTHPELHGNLWTNEKECGKDPKVDNDGNGLAGDCHGWNFTESKDTDAAKDPTDNDGHGTHVAGIIAAAVNGSGIAGVAPNALIMPIKVMKDTGSKSDVPSSEAFARGIVYAVDNGARVINMSLGWPRSLETQFLREAIFYALSKNILIVAAAGNNNSSEPLFPCAYEGVLCVAASTLNGDFAGFSNYGGHIDTVAPGEGILSLHPMKFEPEFFSVPGFEVRSGTSQSSPVVAGLLAELISQEDNLTIDEVLGRLYLAEKSTDKEKYVLGGKASWTAVSTKVSVPVVRPVLKRVRQIMVRNDMPQKINIPLRNYGLPSGPLKVSVTSLSRGIRISGDAQDVEALPTGGTKDLGFSVEIADLFAESNVAIRITISDGVKEESYLEEIPVVRDIRQDPGFKKFPFVFVDKPIPVGGIRNGEIATLLNSMEAVDPGTRHQFFLRRTLKDGDKSNLELTLIERLDGKYQQLPKTMIVKNFFALVNFKRADLNFDGVEDYIIQTVTQEGDKKSFTFSFYNQNLDALWPSFQDVKVNLDLYVENLNTLSLVAYQHPKLGKIMVPSFISNGVMPKDDQNLTSWDRVSAERKKRLYYLRPSEHTFTVRALATKTWEESLKQELNAKWFEEVSIEQVLPQTPEDLKTGSVRALVAVGLNSLRQLFVFKFDTKSNAHGVKIPQLVLQTDTIDPLLKVSPQGLQKSGDVYFNVYDRSRSKVVVTKGLGQESELVYKHDSETDIIAAHLASFEKDSGKVSILQSREQLITISSGGQTKITKRKKLRYSFLSQKLLSELYYPVIYKRNGVALPALYVDGTSVTGNRVYLFEEQDGNLVASIRNSLVIPGNCKALNPNFNGASGDYEFIFLCQEDQGWVIRTLEMQ